MRQASTRRPNCSSALRIAASIASSKRPSGAGPGISWTIAIEETRSTGNCNLPQPEDDLTVYTESHSPAVASTTSPVSSVPSAAPTITPQLPTTSDGCTLSRGVGSPKGSRWTLFAGMIFLLGLGWLRGRNTLPSPRAPVQKR